MSGCLRRKNERERWSKVSEMIPLWLCIPFAGLLLCIAVLPLIKPHWWEEHQPHAVAFWSLLFVVPFALMYGVSHASETVLELSLIHIYRRRNR